MYRILCLTLVVAAVLIAGTTFNSENEEAPLQIIASLELQKQDFRNSATHYGENGETIKVRNNDPGVDWFIIRRTLNSDTPISIGLDAARKQLDMQEASMALHKTGFVNQWSNIGPFNIAGRSRVVVFDPSDANILYTGAAAGGVWKSTDAGNTWVAKTDHFTTLAVGDIAIDKNNPNIVFAGTGEGSNNWDRVYGDGLYRSSDAGETWTNIMESREVENDECINSIALHPESSDTIYCALRGGNSGILKTTDAGASWVQVQGGVGREVIVDPHKPEIVYVAIAHSNGSGNNGIWISDSNGVRGSFKRADSLLPVGDSIGNISIDVSPSKPGYLVAVISKGYLINRTSDGYVDSRDFLGVFTSTDYGQSWSRAAASEDSKLSRFMRGQADYNLYARFHPTDHNIIFMGGIHNWRSTDFGASFKQVSNYHTWVDLHSADFSPANPDVMAVASDGGVYITQDCQQEEIQWSEKATGLATMQFYGMDFDPQNTSRVAGGTQDRRNNMLDLGDVDWTHLSYGGDGGYVAFDAEDSDIFYVSSQYGNFARTKDGGVTFKRLTGGLEGANKKNFGFVTPFIMHPEDSKTLFLGGQKMFRLEGDTWVAISESLTKDSTSFKAFQDLAICKNNPDVLWGVTGNKKRVFRTLNCMDEPDQVQWEMVNGVQKRVPGLFLSAVAVHPDSGDVAYVGTLEFQVRSGVYKTTDGGVSWMHMKGSTPETTLPSVPIGAINVYEPDPNIVFAGTDVGVYISRNGGWDWLPFNNGLPRVVVDDLKITADGILYAATHGRGMWMTDISLVSVEGIDEAMPSNMQLGQNYPNPFNPSTTIPYTVNERSNVTLEVFDSHGALVNKLVDRTVDPGSYTASFDARAYPSGSYFYRLTIGADRITKKMLLMK
jgi:photosystem II stability/assembly factor-like uncharacterized protein